MDSRTFNYLKGRFGDYYRQASLPLPPKHKKREWGYIPWTESKGTTMVRHHSVLDMGDVEEFIARKKPQHVYFSASKYRKPGASKMEDKEWENSDLVFDLDADHLESVTLGEDTYATMLYKCKEEVTKLIHLLEHDFGFKDMTIVFSGGRGYHVHIRDENVQEMGREERSEIVNYVQGKGFNIDQLFSEEAKISPRYIYQTSGGWGKYIHNYISDFVSETLEKDDTEAIKQLTEFEGIGPTKGQQILNEWKAKEPFILGGVIPQESKTTEKLYKTLAERGLSKWRTDVDEPVTTDINRLIRLPGSLHGGSGLRVTHIDPGDLEEFDPLKDAIPDVFKQHEIQVDIKEETLLEFNGEEQTVQPGVRKLPEYKGIFLMARGEAEKETE